MCEYVCFDCPTKCQITTERKKKKRKKGKIMKPFEEQDTKVDGRLTLQQMCNRQHHSPNNALTVMVIGHYESMKGTAHMSNYVTLRET